MAIALHQKEHVTSSSPRIWLSKKRRGGGVLRQPTNHLSQTPQNVQALCDKYDLLFHYTKRYARMISNISKFSITQMMNLHMMAKFFFFLFK